MWREFFLNDEINPIVKIMFRNEIVISTENTSNFINRRTFYAPDTAFYHTLPPMAGVRRIFANSVLVLEVLRNFQPNVQSVPIADS